MLLADGAGPARQPEALQREHGHAVTEWAQRLGPARLRGRGRSSQEGPCPVDYEKTALLVRPGSHSHR